MGVCIRYFKNEEEAVAILNAVFLKILNNLENRKPQVPFVAWIRRIAINTVIDNHRKNQRHNRHIVYTDFEDVKSQSCCVDFNEAAQQFEAEELLAIIRTLPPVSQRVFNLFAIDGYSHKEVAEMLNISEGTSKWHVSFARKTIQGKIQSAMLAGQKIAI